MSYRRIHLRPVFVTSPGRSGSTLLMRLLGSSPAIAMERSMPYEAMYCQYLDHLTRQLERPTPQGWERRQFVEQLNQEAPMIGPVPWPPRMRTIEGGDRLARRVFLAAWHQFSAQVLEREPEAKWWAEKRPRLSMRMPPLDHRELFLVRDPRDVFASWRAFGKKWDRDVMRSIDEFIVAERRLLERARKGFSVRYEDLIEHPNQTAARISGWLDVTPGLSVPKEFDARHATAASAHESIGRWKDTEDSASERITAELLPLLDEFGYR